MNKKEAAAFEQLKQDLRLAKAFSWTPVVLADVAPPTSSSKAYLTTGWCFNAYHSGFGGDTVDVACSSSTSHAKGRTDRTTTQRPVWLFSSKLRALQALRHAVELQCAKRLADIDARIEKELAAEASPNGTDE